MARKVSICGRRALARITSFELVLLLIIGAAIQQALLGNDNSMTSARLVVLIVCRCMPASPC